MKKLTTLLLFIKSNSNLSCGIVTTFPQPLHLNSQPI